MHIFHEVREPLPTVAFIYLALPSQVRSSTSVGGTATSSLQDTLKLFQDNLFSGSSSAMQHYMQQRATCKWQQQNPSSRAVRTKVGSTLTSLQVDEDNTVQLYACTLKSSMRETWVIERAGPFHFRAGEISWYNVQWQSLKHAFQMASIAAYLMSPLSSTMIPIGAPPVNVHHAHGMMDFTPFNNEFNQIFVDPVAYSRQPFSTSHFPHGGGMFAQVHGDSICSTYQGGPDCYMRHFPDGFGIPLPSGSVDLDATFQDLRINRSRPLTLWWENAFKFTAHVQTPIIPFYTWNPWTREPLLVPTFLLHDRRRVGIHWYEFRMPISGQYVWYYYHTHHHWVSDVMTFSATPKQLGLQDLWPEKPPWEIHYVHDTSSFSSLKQRMIESLMAAKQYCSSFDT